VPHAVWLEVVAEDGAGRRRALNHFNKHAKGELARAFAQSGEDPATLDEFVAWGAAHGFALEPQPPLTPGAARRVALVTH
jgi:hypothetical protein